MQTNRLSLIPDQISIVAQWSERTITIDGKPLDPKESIKLRNHSPDGFAWGYGGSGPAQTALSILLAFLPKELALAHYQSFKEKEIATWPQSDYSKVVKLKSIIDSIITQENNTLKSSHRQHY